MDHLPDDVLLMVMSRLDLLDLFSCRLVCRRFASLALHPDVWRDKCLRAPGYFNRFTRLFCPVLRLAPCLDLLTISLPCRRTCHPLFSGSCAARRLHINVLEGGPAHAALLIRHQRELGRLKRVELNIKNVPSEVDAPLLFETLAATPGLDFLDITPGDEEQFLNLDCCPRSLQPTAPASLRSFGCPLGPSLVHFFNFMLAGHAATLQQVSMLNYEDVPAPSTTALLLAQMPNLTYLQCPIFPEMQAVAACASLRSLRLEIYPRFSGVQAHAPAAAALLRRAHQLTSVDLKYICDDPYEDGLLHGVELIMALASSGRSFLEELSIDHDYDERTTMLPLLRELRLSLRSLPSLRYFKMNVRRDAFLVEVEELLKEKPSLHVEIGS